MPINFIKVEDKLKQLNNSTLSLTVLDNNIKDCVIMRAQLEATLSYNAEKGPYVISDKHDDKCHVLLQLEKQSPSDLVIFPEYCISYNIIDEIVSNSTLHPGPQKLWCLPCQGISLGDFIEKMKQYKALGAIIIDDAYTGVGFQQKQYINALIYCFISTDMQGVSHITLVPQIKTYPMRDDTYLCEDPYMCCGNTVFIFGGLTGIGLLSLLCADSLNPLISWNDIREQAQHLIVLHPQLNTNPKQEDFSCIRKEIFKLTKSHVYISCNWAKRTNIVDETGALMLQIQDSWSCIYYRQDLNYNIEQWHRKNTEQLKKNAAYLLYAGFIKEKKVSVWYADSCELAHKFILQKPCYDGPAILFSSIYVAMRVGWIWNNTEWVEMPEDLEKSYRQACYEKELDAYHKEIFDIIIADERYNFPFVCNYKDEADDFFELVLAKDILSCISIDSNEDLKCPTIIVDRKTKDSFQKSCIDLYKLIEQLKKNNFPSHLAYYCNNHHFGLCRNSDVRTNFSNDDSSKNMIVAIAQDEVSAKRFIKNMQSTILKKYSKDNDDEFPYKICVYAENVINKTYEIYPKFDISNLSPERIHNIADITQGGSDNDRFDK